MTPSHARPELFSASYTVGRRNTPPLVLMALAVMWLAAGVVCEMYLHASWRLIPTIVACGVGVLYLRAATGAYLRTGR
jgi:hypothetical protein